MICKISLIIVQSCKSIQKVFQNSTNKIESDKMDIKIKFTINMLNVEEHIREYYSYIIYIPFQRRIAYSIWLYHLGLSWVAMQAAPEVTPCQLSPGRVDDRYRRPSIQAVSPQEVAEFRKWLAEAQPP